MEPLFLAEVSPATGVANDARGRRKPGGTGKRQVTVLSREAWEAACADLGTRLDWTARRANLLVEGLALERTTGSRLRIGDATLEVTGETDPCAKMDQQMPGLEAALRPDWRGGVTCRVLSGGAIAVGDSIALEA